MEPQRRSLIASIMFSLNRKGQKQWLKGAQVSWGWRKWISKEKSPFALRNPPRPWAAQLPKNPTKITHRSMCLQCDHCRFLRPPSIVQPSMRSTGFAKSWHGGCCITKQVNLEWPRRFWDMLCVSEPHGQYCVANYSNTILFVSFVSSKNISFE
jgi:hypothetical protein